MNTCISLVGFFRKNFYLESLHISRGNQYLGPRSARALQREKQFLQVTYTNNVSFQSDLFYDVRAKIFYSIYFLKTSTVDR